MLLNEHKLTAKEEKALFLEFPVDPRCAPFLITATQRLMWVSKTNASGNIRSAFQPPKDTGLIYSNIIEEIVSKSEESDWGLVFPKSRDGLKEALERMAYYEIDDIEFIAPAEESSDLIPDNAQRVSWLQGCILIVPKNRDYLGNLLTTPRNKTMALIHNASRGICILR